MSQPAPPVRFVNPSTLHSPVGYSHVAEFRRGQTVYIAGQVALDASGAVVGRDDLRTQARQVFTNLNAALAAVGADFASVVRLTYYLLDISQIPVVREVRDQFVNTQAPPTSSAVEVRRLFRPEFLIEVDAVAVLPD
jgi:enamine deaminase RidA (YjgF/YER057c/UK114 family)